MNLEQQTQEQEQEPEQRAAAAAIPTTAQSENAMARFDPDTLKAMTTSNVMGSGMVAFLPQSMAEAMELAKLMAASTFVPPHLRGNRGDCLAIVLQSIRWRADPFAVANKSYFVNDRMAFEAQLVNAVLNTSNVLDGRLQITWKGQGPTLDCTVRGRIKGDADVHELTLESAKITTKNSPLWKQAERVQLAYYTSRAWGRLYTPEVMLGIYTPDEIEDAREITDPVRGTQQVIPPRPTREATKAELEAARKAEHDMNQRYRETVRETPAHNAQTGEVDDSATEDEDGDGPPPDDAREQTQTGDRATGGTAPPPPAQAPKAARDVDYDALAGMIIGKVDSVSTAKGLTNLYQVVYAQDIDLLRTEAADVYDRVQASINKKKAWFAR